MRSEEQQRRAFFRALSDRPLDILNAEDRKLYVRLHDDAHDPIARMAKIIGYRGDQSVQLVAGFRGTGKTTEFSRLENDLVQAGSLVIRIDLEDYVDMTSPVDVRELLLLLAGAISDKLTGEELLGPKEGPKMSFWERAKSLLPTVSDLSVGAGPAGIKVALRGDRGFRAEVRSHLARRVTELQRVVHDHHREVLKKLKERHGDKSLVVILDSLEHLRGLGSEEEDVQKSVEQLFVTHAERITLPATHLVVSVPAFLHLRAKNLASVYMNGEVQAWPTCQPVNKRGEATGTFERLVKLIEQRGDWRMVLPDRQALDQVIVASGGHLRDLLNMLIEAIIRTSDGAKATAESVIQARRAGYLPLFKDDIALLQKVARTQALDTLGREERTLLFRHLDAGLVLCYLNGEFWYDVHPLVKQYVLDAKPTSSPPGSS